MGTWAVNGNKEDRAEVYAAISFTIPLAVGLAPANVHYVPTGSLDPSCPGTALTPTAAKGHLCVYEGQNQNLSSSSGLIGNPQTGGAGAGVSGAILALELVEEGGEQPPAFADGSWAVNAP